MSRWNIAALYLFSRDGRRRDLPFWTDGVSIITGESGTGKSAIWKLIDYCLGSSKCRVPNLITDRCSAFGVHWVSEDLHLLTFRLSPKPEQATSTTMYVTYGRDLAPSNSVDQLQGRMNVRDGKAFIESAFGIGDVKQDGTDKEATRRRISVRHTPPYLFLPGQILMSETVLFHGTDEKEKADAVQRTIQYFLRVVDEQTLALESQIRQSRRALEIATRRERAADAATDWFEEDARRLLAEAEQAGIASAGTSDADYPISDLRMLLDWSPQEVPQVGEHELADAYRDQEIAIEHIRYLDRQRRAARRFAEESQEYAATVERQRESLGVVELLDEHSLTHECPVCGTQVDETSDTLQSVRAAYSRLKEQGDAGRRRAPQLEGVIEQLNGQIGDAREHKRQIDARLNQLVGESDSAQRIRDYNQRAARIIGRISYFLDSYDKANQAQDERKSAEITERLETLESQWSQEARERERSTAEQLLSDHMTNIIATLPVEEPLEGARVYISLTQLNLWIKTQQGRTVPLDGIGSDENYMALHIALLVAVHRVASERNAPIPGVLVVDQVSRPYFPAEETKGRELEFGVDAPDKETFSLRKHIEFLFNEVGHTDEFQIILLEHAYFSGDPRYVEAVVERWTSTSGLKLVPPNWPAAEVGGA